MIRYLLFDVDNTLYSSSYGLEDNVQRRIKEYAAAYLGVSAEEAWRQRNARIQEYGTTLEWLIAEKGFTGIEEYFAAVHPPGEVDGLSPDPALRAFLEGIPLPKAILTNAPAEHAKRVLDKLEINGVFTHLFDIRQFAFFGKPNAQVFNRVLETIGAAAQEVLYIDDNPRYVNGFLALGGSGLLLDENNVHGDYPHPKIAALRELTRYL
jgi:putative hydrolase of the HAD superfamily